MSSSGTAVALHTRVCWPSRAGRGDVFRPQRRDRGWHSTCSTGVRRLGSAAFVIVVGPSGSGKSSLTRAGLVPRLRKDNERWLVVDPFRPGRDPVAELAVVWPDAFRPLRRRRGTSTRSPSEIRGFVDDPRGGQSARPHGERAAATESNGPRRGVAGRRPVRGAARPDVELTRPAC